MYRISLLFLSHQVTDRQNPKRQSGHLQGKFIIPKIDCKKKKVQRTQGLSIITNVTFLGHITSCYSNFHHLQNLDQASTSNSQPIISILTKLQLRIFTKPCVVHKI